MRSSDSVNHWLCLSPLTRSKMYHYYPWGPSGVTLSVLVYHWSSCEVKPSRGWSGPPQAAGSRGRQPAPTSQTTAKTRWKQSVGKNLQIQCVYQCIIDCYLSSYVSTLVSPPSEWFKHIKQKLSWFKVVYWPSSQCSWPSSPGPSAVFLRPRRPPGTLAPDPWCAAAPLPPRWAPEPWCSAHRSAGGGAQAAWEAPAGGSGIGRRSWWPTPASPGDRASLGRSFSPTSLPSPGGGAKERWISHMC